MTRRRQSAAAVSSYESRQRDGDTGSGVGGVALVVQSLWRGSGYIHWGKAYFGATRDATEFPSTRDAHAAAASSAQQRAPSIPPSLGGRCEAGEPRCASLGPGCATLVPTRAAKADSDLDCRRRRDGPTLLDCAAADERGHRTVRETRWCRAYPVPAVAEGGWAYSAKVVRYVASRHTAAALASTTWLSTTTECRAGSSR